MPTNDVEIIIEGCNLDSCTLPPSSSSSSSSISPSIFVPFCGVGSEEEGLVEEVAGEVERMLEEGRLEEAFGVLVAVGGVQNCADIEVIVVQFFVFYFFTYLFLFSLCIAAGKFN